MSLNLTDDERTALIGLLIGVIENDPFPQSPRVQQLRGIVTKLRADSRTVRAGDQAGEPETNEPAEVDEAEAFRLAADFSSDVTIGQRKRPR
jgi:hypothetical protein